MGYVAGLVSVVWTLATYWLIYRDNMLTPEQMLKKFREHTEGLPGIWHLGLASDLTLFSCILSLVVGLHGSKWTTNHILVASLIGIVLSAVMHISYTTTPFPDPLAWEGNYPGSEPAVFTPAGWMHFVYMAAGFMILGLFYLYSTPTHGTLVLVSALLVVHVVIGNHILLGVVNAYQHFVWCPEFLKTPVPWIFVGVVGLLVTGLSWLKW